MTLKSRTAFVVAAGLVLAGVLAAPSAVGHVAEPAPTPPMGWNSWNTFGCDISEELIREAADAMVATGLHRAGYDYVVVDDCWFDPRRGPQGELRAHPERFPSGMRALADYVHSKGLKFGLYQVPTEKTCAQRGGFYPGTTGSLGHERQDARTFAEWGVDYLKYDWCSPEGTLTDQIEAFTLMRDALRDTGRTIVYSINANSYHEEKNGARHNWSDIADLSRTTEDIKPVWRTGNPNTYPMGVVDILDVTEPLADRAGPGYWNDPDMLEVGVYDVEGFAGLTDTEAQAHFSMWAMMAAPLIAGNDIRDMSPAVHRILGNQWVIDVDQDPLGEPGRRVRDDGDIEVWARPLANGDTAVALLNRTAQTTRIRTDAREVGAEHRPVYLVWDLWKKRPFTTTGELAATVPAHGVTLLRVRG